MKSARTPLATASFLSLVAGLAACGGGASFTPPAPAGHAPVAYLAPSGADAAAGTVLGGPSGALVAVVAGTQVEPQTFAQRAIAIAADGTAVSAAARGTRAIADRRADAPPELFAAGAQNLRAALPAATTSADRGTAVRVRAQSLGAQRTFWVQQGPLGGTKTNLQRVATLLVQTAHADIWIDRALTTVIAQSSYPAIAADVENAYLSDAEHFGTPAYTASSPGMQPAFERCGGDGAQNGSGPAYIAPPADGRFDILIVDAAALGGTGGYFNSADLMAQSALDCLNNGGSTYESNELPLVVVGWSQSMGSDYELQEDLVRASAHELQHLVNFVHHAILPGAAASASYRATESPYINEGLSMLAQDLAVARMDAGSGVAHDVDDALRRANVFLAAPQNYSIEAFTGIDPGESAPSQNCGEGCYGGAFLLQRYLYDRFGGDAYLRAVESGPVGSANLQAATGEPVARLLGDFALSLAAASGGVAAQNPAFAPGALVPGSAYLDQFGSHLTLAAAGAAGVSDGTVDVPAGGLAFVQLAGAPAVGEPVAVSDRDGTGELLAGYAEQER